MNQKSKIKIEEEANIIPKEERKPLEEGVERKETTQPSPGK